MAKGCHAIKTKPSLSQSSRKADKELLRRQRIFLELARSTIGLALALSSKGKPKK
jgi:hypothetical protein